MSKKCTPLWREAHFQVKSAKIWGVRSTFGRSDGGPMAGLRGSAPLPQTRWALTSMHYDHKKKEYQRPSHIPRFFPNLMFFLLLTLLSPAFLLLLLALLALAPGPSCSPFLLCAAWRPSLKPFSCQGSKKAASPHSNSMAVKDGTGPRATACTA